jgi:hypothetical protein
MDFAAFSILTGYTNETLYNLLVSQVTDLIEVELGNIFTLEETTERYYGQNMDRVDIGAWQPDIIITLDSDILIEYDDYKLDSYSGNPILGVTLNRIFHQDEYITIEGTKGWSDGYPADIQRFIFDYVRKAYLSSENTKNNFDGLKMVENHSSKDTFDNTAQRDMDKFLINPMGSDTWKKISRKYKKATNKVICSNTQ